MTIKLKANVYWLKTQIKCESGIVGSPDPDTHDAAVAHALLKAMGTLRMVRDALHPDVGKAVDALEQTAINTLRDDFGIED